MIVTKTNTTIERLAGSHIVKVSVDTGLKVKDASGADVPELVVTHTTIQELELSKGIMLPKARRVAVIQAAVDKAMVANADLALDVL